MPTPYQQEFGSLINPQGPQVGQGPVTQAPPAMAQPGVPPGPQPSPPKDAQDLQQRTTGWAQFLQNLANPSVSQALINAGATMLSPRQPGESQGYKIAQGLAVGAKTVADENTAKAQEARQNKMVDIQQQNADANTAQTAEEINRSKAQIPLISAQIEKLKSENSPEQKQASIDEIKARIRLYDAQAAREKATARVGTGSDSAEMQQFKTRVMINSRTMPEADAYTQAYDEVFNKPKEFKMVTPEEFAADLRIKAMNTIAGLKALETTGNVDSLIANDVAAYTERYNAERPRSTGLGNLGPTRDPNARYNAMVQQFQASGQQPTPDDLEKFRMATIRAFGLPQTWKPQ